MYNNIFRSYAFCGQYLSAREREKLISDYLWARESYRKAVVEARRAYEELEARRAYEELVRRSNMPDDNDKSGQ